MYAAEMKTLDDNDDFLTRMEIALDGETRRRLIRAADEAHTTPRVIASAIVRAVLEDDALAHGELVADPKKLH